MSHADAMPAERRIKRSSQAGFTLMEMVVVMTIIALMAALVAPQIFSRLNNSKIKTTKAQIEMLSTALNSFRLDVGRYPSQAEGLKALVEKPSAVENWTGPYLKKRELPKDAWNHDFAYMIPPTKGGVDYDLYSAGPEDKPDGQGIISNR